MKQYLTLLTVALCAQFNAESMNGSQNDTNNSSTQAMKARLNAIKYSSSLPANGSKNDTNNSSTQATKTSLNAIKYSNSLPVKTHKREKLSLCMLKTKIEKKDLIEKKKKDLIEKTLNKLNILDKKIIMEEKRTNPHYAYLNQMKSYKKEIHKNYYKHMLNLNLLEKEVNNTN